MTAGMKRVSYASEFRLGLVDGASEEDLSQRRPGGLYDAVVEVERGGKLYTMARTTLAMELLTHIPADRLKLSKRFVDVVTKGDSEPVTLVFADGTTAEADAVVGCDGVKSGVRRVMLSPSHPGAICQYAHEVCYRTLVDLAPLRELLGPLSESTGVYVGPGAYLIVYPVGARANISVYVADDTPWPSDQSHGQLAPRAKLVDALAKLGPSLRGIADILPDQDVSVWALHDLFEHPLETYAFGRVCLAGDAAHAATSHHGAGAGTGMEDAAVLCQLLDRVNAEVVAVAAAAGAKVDKAEMIKSAMKIFDEARRERSQWLVWSSRRQGQVMKHLVPEIGGDMGKIKEDVAERTKKLLAADVQVTLDKTLRDLNARITKMKA